MKSLLSDFFHLIFPGHNMTLLQMLLILAFFASLGYVLGAK